MGEDTSIGWCHHTFNPWWGCTEISPGCDECYARKFAHFTGEARWGKDEPRRFFGEKHWNEPLKWDRLAAEARERRRVFCGSMCDIGEVNDALDAERAKIWPLVRRTSNLDWLLLTKRPDALVTRYLPDDWGQGYANGWLGTTVENDSYRWRIERILKAPAVVHFLSVEPQIGPVHLAGYLKRERDLYRVDWVIVGGESGGNARPFDLGWAEDIVAICKEFDVACYVKQVGAKPQRKVYDWNNTTQDTGRVVQFKPKEKKGADMLEWPEKIRVREFPVPFVPAAAA